MILFARNNLLLLAEQYSIDAAKAAIIQAKVWEQPYFSGELNIVNPQDRRIIDVGAAGQKSFAIQQLIYMGGKKKKEIDFAKSNVSISELQFEQLLRNLQYQLAQNIYIIYFEQQKVLNIELQSRELDKLLITYEVQVNKGNLALKDVVRLQTLALGLKNEKTILQKQIAELQQELQLLTGISEKINPTVNENEILSRFSRPKIEKDSLLNISMTKNPDYLLSDKIAQNQDLYLQWQKALAVPDITAGLSYDQRGGAFNNQVNLTFGIPLNFWNKNKGNIKIAEAKLSQSNLAKTYKRNELQSHIDAAWEIWEQQQEQFSSISATTAQNLETVYQGMLINFQKRNITILEFTDFMESYNQSTIQLSEMKKQLVMAGLQLNYITNTDVL